MNNLVDLKVSEFIDLLASDAPAPGGGSAAALTSAMGAGLIYMVTQLTVGRKKYAQVEDLMVDLAEKANAAKSALVKSIDADTVAYNAVSAAYGLPKETDEEKKARSRAIQQALQGATKTPFTVMELSLDAMRLAHLALGKSNANAASDLGVAALNLSAGVHGAWLNVEINLSGIKDEGFVQKYNDGGKKILEEADRLASEIKAGL